MTITYVFIQLVRFSCPLLCVK